MSNHGAGIGRGARLQILDITAVPLTSPVTAEPARPAPVRGVSSPLYTGVSAPSNGFPLDATSSRQHASCTGLEERSIASELAPVAPSAAAQRSIMSGLESSAPTAAALSAPTPDYGPPPTQASFASIPANGLVSTVWPTSADAQEAPGALEARSLAGACSPDAPSSAARSPDVHFPAPSSPVTCGDLSTAMSSAISPVGTSSALSPTLSPSPHPVSTPLRPHTQSKSGIVCCKERKDGIAWIVACLAGRFYC
jgi:hypothetical protein